MKTKITLTDSTLPYSYRRAPREPPGLRKTLNHMQQGENWDLTQVHLEQKL